MRKICKKIIAMTTVLGMVISLVLPSIPSNAAGQWGSDSNGWYYYNGSSYYAGQWAEIGGYWYYFLSSGYMDYSEYRDGCWLGPDGIWNTAYSNGQWKVNSNGWWFEDSGWYPSNQWLWINGYCYYFAESGYMEYNCYRDGCWLGSDGAWVEGYSGQWKGNDTGWWFEDSSGWYPSNQGLWINGEYYWFNADGYWDKDESKKKKASGEAGRTSASGGNGAGGSGSGGVSSKEYSYQIFSMLPPLNEYFYIQTDNPDPDSFYFVDELSVYGDNGTGSITPSLTLYSDVKYENTNTLRVKGGYICNGSNTDGGKLRLKTRVVTGEYPIYNVSTGETTYAKQYKYENTDITVDIGPLVDRVDYLIQNYSGSATDFFEKLTNIQSGFSSVCLYSGASIRGELYKSESSPYYGISNSPHIDQGLYVQSPYSRKDTKRLLISEIYPFIYDSIGFPSMMGEIAKRIDPSSSYTWSPNNHWLIVISHNGTTGTYGGQGYGGGKAITPDKVNNWYTFDKSGSDAYMKADLSEIAAQLNYYGGLAIPDDIPEEGKLTAEQIRRTVGEGKYCKILGLVSIYGSTTEAYTFLYDNGGASEGPSYNINVGRFSNAWYDGRYFNRYETFEKGVKFGENSKIDTVTNTGTASIIIKNAIIKIPDDGKTYYYNYSKTIPSNYNTSTGVWSGYTTYNYDSASGNWIADQYNKLMYYESGYKNITEADFVAACTLTPEEVEAMGVDKNTDILPNNYLIYDMKTAIPGTPVGSGN